jgi:hypothetical protein
LELNASGIYFEDKWSFFNHLGAQMNKNDVSKDKFRKAWSQNPILKTI